MRTFDGGGMIQFLLARGHNYTISAVQEIGRVSVPVCRVPCAMCHAKGGGAGCMVSPHIELRLPPTFKFCFRSITRSTTKDDSRRMSCLDPGGNHGIFPLLFFPWKGTKTR